MTANEEEVPGLEIPARICSRSSKICVVASLTGSGGSLGRGRNRGGGGRIGHGRGRGGGGRLRGRDGGAGGGDHGYVGGRGEGLACGPPALARGRGLSDEEEVGDGAG